MSLAFLEDPTFWVLVSFVIFIGATAKPLFTMATAGLDKRAEKIRADMEEAESFWRKPRTCSPAISASSATRSRKPRTSSTAPRKKPNA